MNLNPKVELWTPTVACCKCGNTEPAALAPYPQGVRPPMAGGQHEHFVFASPAVVTFLGPIHVKYCPGGKELETDVELDPMQTMAQVVAQAGAVRSSLSLPSPKKHINICAGIGNEHLHRVCSHCQYEWLTETKDSGAAA